MVNKNTSGMSIKEKLSLLWIFLMFNYAYGDILTLVEGKGAPFEITPEFLLGAAIYIEISIVMIVLSRVLQYKVNRWANIITGLISALGLIGSMFVEPPPTYYVFLGVIEIVCLSLIVWTAWKWRESEAD